jgi:hypothetical protein
VKFNILWIEKLRSLRSISGNKLDIIISENNKRTCILISVALLGDRNIIRKEAEKIFKYQSIILEIQSMWNVKAKVIQVIILATAPLTFHA